MDDQEIIFPEWRNSAAHTKYPFTDDATLTNLSGLTIDQDLFDDARIYPVGGSVGMYLSSVEVTATGLFFHISDPISGELAKGGYLFANPIPDNIALYDQFGRAAGVLVSSAARLQAAAGIYPVGNTEFTQAQTEFAPTATVPIPNTNLRGILLDDGGFISGDIYLVGTNGIVLTEESGAIRIDVVGDPYALAKACQSEGFVVTPFCGLRTINHIPPDQNGDFKLTPGGNLSPQNIIRIVQDTAGNLEVLALGAIS